MTSKTIYFISLKSINKCFFFNYLFYLKNVFNSLFISNFFVSPKVRKSFTTIRAMYVHKKSKIQFEYLMYRLSFKIQFSDLFSSHLCKKIEYLLLNKNNILNIQVKLKLYKSSYCFFK